VREELKSGERLLWTAQPICNRAWYPSIPIVLFAIPWTLFSLSFVVVAFRMTRHVADSNSSPTGLMPFAVPLFGLLFVLVGVWMLSTPYWMRRRAQKTVYALTDQRALILTPAWRNAVTVRSIRPEDLSARTRTQRPDGSGSIFFTRLTVIKPDAEGGTRTETVGFEHITDVRAVEELIERTYPAPASQGADLL
jgi:hypothetical protein